MLQLQCIPWFILFVWVGLFLDNYKKTTKEQVLAGKKSLTLDGLILQPWTDLLHSWFVTLIINDQAMMIVKARIHVNLLEEHSFTETKRQQHNIYKWNDKEAKHLINTWMKIVLSLYAAPACEVGADGSVSMATGGSPASFDGSLMVTQISIVNFESMEKRKYF